MDVTAAFSRIRVGDRVVITAKDEFFAFVDGWKGTVSGWNGGLAVVDVVDAEAQAGGFKKQFLVPPDQLALSVA